MTLHQSCLAHGKLPAAAESNTDPSSLDGGRLEELMTPICSGKLQMLWLLQNVKRTQAGNVASFVQAIIYAWNH